MSANQSTPNMLDRSAIAKVLGIGEFHAGELLRKGAFKGAVKVQRGTTKTQKWVAPEAAVKAYAQSRKSGVGKRADGRTKWTIYLTDEEYRALNIAFPKALIQRANPPKASE
jgi:hypothetical protein